MALTITTNMASLNVQRNMTNATNSLNQAIQRMTTGYKINSASDNAAGYFVARNMEVQLSSVSVAEDNCALGISLLSTADSNYDLVSTHLQRIRDLTEEAANGTYDQKSIDAIKEEVSARLDEIDRVTASCEFNGIKLMNGSKSTGINIQCGIDSTSNSVINLESDLFAASNSSAILGVSKSAFLAYFTVGGSNYSTALNNVDSALNNVTTRQTKIGAYENRLESANDSLVVKYDNTTESLSTVRDADIAQESSSYVQAQILQQAAATLLSTANQSPSIALSLI